MTNAIVTAFICVVLFAQYTVGSAQPGSVEMLSKLEGLITASRPILVDESPEVKGIRYAGLSEIQIYLDYLVVFLSWNKRAPLKQYTEFLQTVQQCKPGINLEAECIYKLLENDGVTPALDPASWFGIDSMCLGHAERAQLVSIIQPYFTRTITEGRSDAMHAFDKIFDAFWNLDRTLEGMYKEEGFTDEQMVIARRNEWAQSLLLGTLKELKRVAWCRSMGQKVTRLVQRYLRRALRMEDLTLQNQLIDALLYYGDDGDRKSRQENHNLVAILRDRTWLTGDHDWMKMHKGEAPLSQEEQERINLRLDNVLTERGLIYRGSHLSVLTFMMTAPQLTTAESASVFVARHHPPDLRRTITERTSITDVDVTSFDNIRVICRFRPPNRRELAYSKKNRIPDQPPDFESEQSITLTRSTAKDDGKQSRHKFKPFRCTLDSIIQPDTAQKEVFYLVGQPMILSCLQGYNATIFAYGQSGSGKTYTMFGPENNARDITQFGLIPRCFMYLFQKLDRSLSSNGGDLQSYTVTMELLQIYKRDLLDLLNPKSAAKLVIKTDFRNNSIFVQNLRSIQVNSVEEAFAVLTEGQSNRIVAGHALNETSSRSHMLVVVNVTQQSIDGVRKQSKLNFGDLAGSEDLTKALGKNPDPERRQEAIAINSSLSALTTAISYLSKGKKPSYRESPLTHILKDSLGGNSKTVMLVACSPHIYNRAETIRALRFAACAKKVKNKAKRNEEQSAGALKKRIKELELQNRTLQAQLVEERAKKQLLGRHVNRLHTPSARTPSMHTASPHHISPHHLSAHSPLFRQSSVDTVMSISTKPVSTKRVGFITESGNVHHPVVHPVPSAVVEAMNTAASTVADSMSPQSVELQLDPQEYSQSPPVDLYAIMKVEGETEFNYIQQIEGLRRELEEMDALNKGLNDEIAAKNVELEECNNRIATLESTNRRLSLSVHRDPLTLLAMESSDSHSDSDNGGGHYIESKSASIELPQPEDVLSVDVMSRARHSNMSASAGNPELLEYLMKLQQNMNETQQHMMELSQTVKTTEIHFNRLESLTSYQHRRGGGDDKVSGDSVTSSSSEEEEEETEDIQRKERLESALNRNLSTKSSGGFFRCFMGEKPKEEKEGTSLLVEEYLRSQVRTEMRRHTRKHTKKHRNRKKGGSSGKRTARREMTLSPVQDSPAIKKRSTNYTASPLRTSFVPNSSQFVFVADGRKQ